MNKEPMRFNHRVDIYFPSRCICGKPLNKELYDRIIEEVRTNFGKWFGGGWSEIPLIGGWRLPNGKVIQEDVIDICCNCNEETFAAHRAEIDQLAIKIANQLTQDGVMRVIDNLDAVVWSNTLIDLQANVNCSHFRGVVEGMGRAVQRKEDTLSKMLVIHGILRGFKSVEYARKLFCTELNYNYSSGEIPFSSWPKEISSLLLAAPTVIANHNDFRIVHLHISTDDISKGAERQIVQQLYKDDPTFRGLFVISNKSQECWELVNVKCKPDDPKQLILRRLQVGISSVRTATERLASLEIKEETDSSITAADLQSRHDGAFDVEAVTKEFFNEYKTHFDLLKSDLNNQTKDNDWAHDFSLQFLNRIMFLYFLQRKNWLGEAHIKNLWTAYCQDSDHDKFVEKWLNVLFFKAFNKGFHGGYSYFPQDIHNDLALAPYLNGGLFTENDIDKAYSVNITDNRFQHILTFLEKYNFSIAEDSPLDKEVAVDPEMIGKVYESLVNKSTEKDEQSESGIYYTHRTEIELMCRLTLVDYLYNHIGNDRKKLLYDLVFATETDKPWADDLVTQAGLWPEISRLLATITVVDPACGSGSFLIGMLNILDDLTRRADSRLGKTEPPFERKKRIIGQSLYGVDVMDWACHVSELRLWLSLIVDADFSREDLHARQDPLLPHFSFKIRCGDSIVQEVGSINLCHIASAVDIPPSLKTRITNLKNEKLKYYNNDPKAKYQSLEAVRQEERKLFSDLLFARERVLEEDVKSLKRKVASPQERQIELDGKISSATPHRIDLKAANAIAQIKDKEEELEQVKHSRQSLSKQKEVPFVWDIAFVEVFEDKQGFDIVIGNPPYVRQELIEAPNVYGEQITQDKKEYKAKLMRAVYQSYSRYFGYRFDKDASAKKLDAKSDLYIYFYFRTLKLLNTQGSFSFITSNSWLDVGYGADLQEFLLKHSHVKLVLDNQVKRCFANADVNAVITLLAPPNDTQDWGLEKTARFVMFKVPFEEILSPKVFEDIEEAGEYREAPEYRIFPIRQDHLLMDGCEIPKEEEKRKPTRQLISSSHYAGNKWGGKYLKAPSIYWTILQKGKDKLVRLGDIADIKFGIKTGADNYFYLAEADIVKYKIEKQYLHPILVSSAQISRFVIERNDTDLFLVTSSASKKELKGTHYHDYILRGETFTFPGRGGASIPAKRPSCKGHRPFWYTINIPDPPPIYWMEMRRERYFTLLNKAGLSADHTFYAIYPQNNVVIESLCGLLNSTVTALMVEVFANDPGGSGTSLQTPIGEMKRYIFIMQQLLQSNEVAAAFLEMAKREIDSILREVFLSDRKILDSIVFDSLMLTKGERDAVYEAVNNLVETRLKKARSTES